MKNIGIIGCGWLGNHIAQSLSPHNYIFATTTTFSKLKNLNNKGYETTLVSIPDHLDDGIKPWDVLHKIDAIIITIPFSGIRGRPISMVERQQNLLSFLGDYKGQVFLISSTGVYPKIDKNFKENDLSAFEVDSEKFILDKFPQTNILRLAGLMGGDRFLKNYNISHLDMLVNHIHYNDICRVLEVMLIRKSQSKVYNVVAPIHPSKEEVINAQKNLDFEVERKTFGRTVSPEKIIQDLDFHFQFPDPTYFHLDLQND